MSSFLRISNNGTRLECRFHWRGARRNNRWQVVLEGFLSHLGTGARQLQPGIEDAAWLLDFLDSGGAHRLNDLKGNFVLFAYDSTEQRLYAARDRLGGRTAFFTKSTSGDWIFAPWAHQVLQHSGLKKRLNSTSIARYFSGRPPLSGQTAFAGILEMRPGEILCISARDVERRSATIQCPSSSRWTCNAEAVDEFRDRFLSSISTRLPSRGPVACMLSGGLDSGPTAWGAASLLERFDRTLRPISWALPDFPEADERRWIETLSTGLNLQTEFFEPDSLPLSQLTHSPDELTHPDWPAFNPFRFLMQGCYRRASESGCKVILNGNAGDDLYVTAQMLLRALWQGGDYIQWFREVLAVLRRSGFLSVRATPELRGWVTSPSRTRAHGVQGLLPSSAEQVLDSLGQEPTYDSYLHPEHAEALLGSRMSFGRAHEQYFAERYGLERRDPFHDEALVEFMLSATPSLSIRNGQTKWVMREAMRNRLPEDFRTKPRTGKMRSFFQAGLEQNLSSIRTLLVETTGWTEWVDQKVIEDSLESPLGSNLALLMRCVGFALWERRLLKTQ